MDQLHTYVISIQMSCVRTYIQCRSVNVPRGEGNDMQQTTVHSVYNMRHALDYSGAVALVLWESRVEGCDSQVKHVRVDHFLLQIHRNSGERAT